MVAGWQAQVTDSTMGSTNSEYKGEKVDNGNNTSITNNSSDKDGKPTGDPALPPFQMNTKDAEKVQVKLATKESAHLGMAMDRVWPNPNLTCL